MTGSEHGAMSVSLLMCLLESTSSDVLTHGLESDNVLVVHWRPNILF